MRVILVIGLFLATACAPFLASSGPEQGHVLVAYDSVRIDVIEQGRGPTIILLPSLGRGSEDYDPVATRLAQSGFRVLRPQPRGIGLSSGPMTGITLHDYARDIAEVIRQRGAGRAVIVGHAYGNWVARMTATDYPDLVRGVSVAGAAARQYPSTLTADIDIASNSAEPRERRLAALQRAFFAPGNDPAIWLTGWSPEVRVAQRAASAATQQSEWWAGGGSPILDLQGDSDPFKPAEKRTELKDEFGDRVTITVAPRASHALFVEQPLAVADAISDWARKLPR